MLIILTDPGKIEWISRKEFLGSKLKRAGWSRGDRGDPGPRTLLWTRMENTRKGLRAAHWALKSLGHRQSLVEGAPLAHIGATGCMGSVLIICGDVT